MKSFIDGITAYGEALRLVGRLGLWGYLFAPVLIGIVVAFGIFGAAGFVSDDLSRLLLSWFSRLSGSKVAESVARIFSAVLIIGVGLVLFKQIVLAVSAPVMSPLSEKVERYLAGDAYPEVRFSVSRALSDLVRGLVIALRNIFRELFFTLLLLVIGLIPLFSFFTPFLIFIVQAYYAGFGNIDYMLERHLRVGESVRFVRRNRMLAIGNGSVFLLLLLSGVGFIFALPLATVAATVETYKRMNKQ
jgi:CysZ protein